MARLSKNINTQSNQVVAAHTRPIINEVAGKIRFQNIVEGVSVTEQGDELTGSTTYLVIDPKSRRGATGDIKPTIELVDGKNKPRKKK